MSKNILVIYTGGTIGMVPSDKGHIPSTDFCDYLPQQLQFSSLPLPDACIDIVATQTLIDSSNSTPHDWLAIANLLIKHWQDYDGYVVLHGTDTMAYSASALSFMLGEIDKPVIFTGAQIPMLSPASDALDNVVGSLAMACQGNIHEVGLFFDKVLWRGNRSSKFRRQALDAFYSPNHPALATYPVTEAKNHCLVHTKPPAFIGSEKAFIHSFHFRNEHVAVITCYPGMDHRMVAAYINEVPLKSIVLQTFGVGNPPDANQALMHTLQEANKQGIVIANISQCPVGSVQQGNYVGGTTLHNLGAIGTSDLTLEATFTKLHVLFAQRHSSESIKRLLTQPLRGECQAQEKEKASCQAEDST